MLFKTVLDRKALQIHTNAQICPTYSQICSNIQTNAPVPLSEPSYSGKHIPVPLSESPLFEKHAPNVVYIRLSQKLEKAYM